MHLQKETLPAAHSGKGGVMNIRCKLGIHDYFVKAEASCVLEIAHLFSRNTTEQRGRVFLNECKRCRHQWAYVQSSTGQIREMPAWSVMEFIKGEG
jgi:hypothetical protein